MSVKYCVECDHSIPEDDSAWKQRCIHPEVNKRDAWALASTKINGSDCWGERQRPWYLFPACGKAGALWEEKSAPLVIDFYHKPENYPAMEDEFFGPERQKAPSGWYYTRKPKHNGPCAARPA